MERPLRILLLCDDQGGNANTILDHINAFGRHSRHDVRTFNPRGMKRSFALDLDEFDAVVIHYSLILASERYISLDFRQKLQRYRGLKAQFIQDEYRWVDQSTAAMRDAGIDLLFTSVPEPVAGQIYDRRLPGVRRVPTLTGYVPEHLSEIARQPPRARAIDVGYRGRDLPFWLGRLAYEKQWIAQCFVERARTYGLRTDIGWREANRIYGQSWVEFLASCKATLGTESGASIVDFDGSVERAVRTYLAKHRGATFDEVHRAVLEPYEGNVVINVISPRVFEAAALGTALIMFPGSYSGIVAPGEHYIVLKKDFSNMDEVVESLKDSEHLAQMTDRVRRDVILSGRWSYRTFVRDFDSVMAEMTPSRPLRRRAPRRRLAIIERALEVPPIPVRMARGFFDVAAAVRGRHFARESEIVSGNFVRKGMAALRAVLADPSLRAMVREGRVRGMTLDNLLEEVLEVSMLRRALTGTLSTVENFEVAVEYEPLTKLLRFTSVPEGERDESNDAGQGLKAVMAGDVDRIHWDHSAVGRAVNLRKPPLAIGIGDAGVSEFGVLGALQATDGAWLERVLGSALRAAALRDREPVP